MKYTFAILFSILLISCGETKQDKATEAPAEEAPKMQYTITAFSPSQSYPDATLTNMTYADGIFNFDVSGEAYQLGAQTPDAPQKMCANSGKGQHIHLIVDNKPYSAQYTSTFEHAVEDGKHAVLAFLSRSYHESIKTENAHILKNVLVQDGAIVESADIEVPKLTYSRPKGTYVGDDTKKVMLDFYVSNIELGNGVYVEANINGEVHNLDTWQPYYIEGLPMGENKITLSLKNAEGLVKTPFNVVDRTFTLKEDPAPEKK